MALDDLKNGVLATDKGVVTTLASVHDGQLQVNIKRISEGKDVGCEMFAIDSIKTTNTATSWSIFVSEAPANSTHLVNRATAIDITSDGQILKVGGRIFLPPSKQNQSRDSFTPKDLSLYIDHITRQGHYLIVTSRQKVTEIPELDESSQDHPTESFTPSSPLNSVNPSQEAKDDDSSSGESEDEVDLENLNSASDRSDMSACESWSEASTEYSSESPAEDIDPQISKPGLEAVLDRDSMTGKTSDDSDASSDLECSSTAQDSDQGSLMGGGDRFIGTQIGEDEIDDLDMIVFNNDDGFRPADDSEGDSDSARRVADEAWDESGFMLFRDNNDFDFDGNHFVPEGDSDSDDDCSACGESGGAACALPDEEAETGGKAVAGDKKDAITTLGTSMAQLHAYDMSEVDETGHPRKIFHYQCSTMSLIRDSPPAVHPRKPLVVWPLGDNKMLFADFKYNTYFIKRVRPSRILAQHVCIDSRFSSDGRYLHTAALELRGNLPKRLKKTGDRTKAGAAKSNGHGQPEKLYDIVLYTSRLSVGKTSRAPPALLRRQVFQIGHLEHVPPSFIWTEDCLLLCCRTEPTRLRVFKLPIIIKQERKFEQVAAKPSPMMLHLPEWTIDREVRVFGNQPQSSPAKCVVTVKPKIQKPSKIDEDLEKDKSEGREYGSLGTNDPESLPPVQHPPVDEISQEVVSTTDATQHRQGLMAACISLFPGLRSTSSGNTNGSPEDLNSIDLSQDHIWTAVSPEPTLQDESSI